MKKIRVGIIGAGFISQVCHISNLSYDHRFEIVALCDKDKLLLKKVSKSFDIKNTYTDYNEMISSSSLDAIFLIVPRTQIFQIYTDIVKFNKFIFVEKPIANNLKQIRDFKINFNNKIFNKTAVGYMKRFDESFIYLKKNIQKYINIYGSVKYVSFINITGNSYYGEKNYKQRSNIKKYLQKLKNNDFINKSALFLNTFGHNIDTLSNLFGENILINKINKEDSSTIILKNIKRDFLISLFCQQNKKHDWTEELNIYFANANIKISFPPALLKNQSGYFEVIDYKKNEKRKIIFKSKWSFDNQLDAFYKFIEGNKKTNLCNIKEAISNIKLSDNFFN